MGRALHYWRQMLMRFADDFQVIHFVDIFNANNGMWAVRFSPDYGEARSDLVATSLPDQGLAIFAGGSTKGMHVSRDL
jgi:hypothetical protein